jgi:hypothetical protein
LAWFADQVIFVPLLHANVNASLLSTIVLTYEHEQCFGPLEATLVNINYNPLAGMCLEGQAWCGGESCLTESPGCGFEAAS